MIVIIIDFGAEGTSRTLSRTDDELKNESNGGLAQIVQYSGYVARNTCLEYVLSKQI